MQKAFIASVYNKSLANAQSANNGKMLMASALRDDVFLRISAMDQKIFALNYEIVFEKWQNVVQEHQTAPKKMRTFADTKRGKKVKNSGKN